VSWLAVHGSQEWPERFGKILAIIPLGLGVQDASCREVPSIRCPDGASHVDFVIARPATSLCCRPDFTRVPCHVFSQISIAAKARRLAPASSAQALALQYGRVHGLPARVRRGVCI
jgi:hypothetical protein